jgi:NAD(P)-dependent dehydrogenase (short-subunit alcohol dehydrogenase family)
VVVADADDRRGRQTLEQLRSGGGEGMYIYAGPQSAQHHRALIQAAIDAYGKLDVACNCHEVGSSGGSSDGVNEPPWHDHVELDLAGLFSGVRAQLEAMLPKGGGIIVNVAAAFCGMDILEEAMLYAAAKLVSLTKIVTHEYGNRGIRVNTLGPAFIGRRLPPSPPAPARANSTGRRAHWDEEQADEVLALIAWLSSDQSSFVTGAYYPIDNN